MSKVAASCSLMILVLLVAKETFIVGLWCLIYTLPGVRLGHSCTWTNIDIHGKEASGGGNERGREGTREGNFKGGILRRAQASIQYIHKPSHNAALAIDTLLLQMKNSVHV